MKGGKEVKTKKTKRKELFSKQWLRSRLMIFLIEKGSHEKKGKIKETRREKKAWKEQKRGFERGLEFNYNMNSWCILTGCGGFTCFHAEWVSWLHSASCIPHSPMTEYSYKWITHCLQIQVQTTWKTCFCAGIKWNLSYYTLLFSLFLQKQTGVTKMMDFYL